MGRFNVVPPVAQQRNRSPNQPNTDCEVNSSFIEARYSLAHISFLAPSQPSNSSAAWHFAQPRYGQRIVSYGEHPDFAPRGAELVRNMTRKRSNEPSLFAQFPPRATVSCQSDCAVRPILIARRPICCQIRPYDHHSISFSLPSLCQWCVTLHPGSFHFAFGNSCRRSRPAHDPWSALRSAVL